MTILPLQDYDIYVGNLDNHLNTILQKRNYTKIFVLVDENTKTHCLPILRSQLMDYQLYIIEIQSGEIYKNINTCQQIWSTLMTAQADRNSLLINLGGGVIGDMGGFCASTFKRGMDFIQIPTTLLAQVDASIGGKLGIDFQQIKNSIGLFQNPQAVFVDSQFLQTLPIAEIRSGYAEILKHSLIVDHNQWQQLSLLKKVDHHTNWDELIVPSLKIKQAIVIQDPFEKGLRKALNFGHTIGHAVESWALETKQPLLHGEAVAIGMVCESYLSTKVTTLTIKDLDKISEHITTIYGKYPLQKTAFPNLIDLMKNDKKNINQAINFTMLSSTGTCQINQTSEPDLIIESLNYYNTL